MSLIKSFFKKELEDIIEPLARIKSDIAAFIQKQELVIEQESDKVKQILEANKNRVEKNIKASTIVKNLETLLGA